MKLDVDWERQKCDFEADGSLRDIYVENATETDWRILMRLVVETDPAAELSRDGERVDLAPLEPRFSDDVTWLLRFDVRGVGLSCHFFTRDEIELDFWPRQLRSERELTALLTFVGTLGRRTGKTVLLTPENGKQHPIFRYEPVDDAVRWIAT